LPHHYRSLVTDALLRLSHRVDPGDCARIALHGLPPETETILKSSLPTEPVKSRMQPDTSDLMSRRILADDSDCSANISLESAVGVVFDRLKHPVMNAPLRGPAVYLGFGGEWAKAPLQLACGRREGYYFATVLDSKKAQ
jgi:hypothetical protein